MYVIIDLHGSIKIGTQQVGLGLVLHVAISRHMHFERRREHLQPLETASGSCQRAA